MAKSVNYSEVDAMKDIDGALAKIDVEAQQRVLEWASSKHGVKLRAQFDVDVSSPHQKSPQPQRATDIKAFLVQKRPESFYERVACLVYFLEKFADQAEVGTKDISKANSDARLSKLTNPAVFVKHATHTYGYLTALGKRKFAISARGEAVVEALPDRTKVEEALAANPFGKKARRKRSKK
ncbi:MAG TPA: hypothetical protein VHV29_07115 [Terriglobales bacterium]|jgi:hypothetical protein|nr:hypothetical protein [Terriglobales bacterium]